MSDAAVSEADRRAMRRQAAAMERSTEAEEVDADTETALRRWADRHREVAGRAPLEDWWADKTEHRFFERARELGMLERAGPSG